MDKGTVYFFTGLSGAGKTTIGGLLYSRMKAKRLDRALQSFRLWKEIADQGIDVVICSIAMYHDCRSWAAEHIENYREIYVKAARETLYRRDQKGLYSSGAKNVVGVDLLCEEPEAPDIVIENDGAESPEEIVDRLEVFFGLRDEDRE